MNQSPDNMEFSYTNWRTSFLRVTLIGASIFGLVAVIPGILGATSPLYAWLYAVVYLILLLLTILPVPSSIKAGALISLIFSLGVLGLTESGIRGDAPIFMLGAITMASLLFSWKAGWVVTGLAMLAFFISGWLITSGAMIITSSEVTPGTAATWASGSTSALLLATVIVNGIRLTQDEFGKAHHRAQAVLDVLQGEKSTLEQRVERLSQRKPNQRISRPNVPGNSTSDARYHIHTKPARSPSTGHAGDQSVLWFLSCRDIFD